MAQAAHRCDAGTPRGYQVPPLLSGPGAHQAPGGKGRVEVAAFLPAISPPCPIVKPAAALSPAAGHQRRREHVGAATCAEPQQRASCMLYSS
ncbi:hypothetical protein HaLaN_12078 [Haematococcus lacustris]|uniref:Uncharacterized protein n=1 Tax=Haematococcus lacustris TaxID=44745 RepID=A0A699ZAB3_HAELA|nr:hypothetical protein HaLaN_12078 [Haematococcus lacustris]